MEKTNKLIEEIFEEFEWKLNESKETQQIANSISRTMDVNSWHERHNKDLKNALEKFQIKMENKNGNV